MAISPRTASGDSDAPASTLPHDVIEEILDHLVITRARSDNLSWNRITLRACSLTCRDWTHMSQRRLFCDMVVNLVDLRRFGALLQASPHLSKYVQSVDFRSCMDLMELAIIPVLSNLRHLSITYFEVQHDTFVSVWKHIREVFPGITSLSLERITAQSLELIFLLPYAFPRLTKLVMDCPLYREVHANRSHLHVLSDFSMCDLDLKYLDITSADDTDVLLDYAILLEEYRFIGCFQLQTLNVAFYEQPVQNRAPIDSFLSTIGSTLQDLTLTWFSTAGTSPNLSSSSALRNVHVNLPIQPDSITELVALLPLARSCSADINFTLTVLIEPDTRGLADDEGWSVLTGELRRHPLRARCNFVVEVWRPRHSRETLILPQCARDAKRDLEEMGISVLVRWIMN